MKVIFHRRRKPFSSSASLFFFEVSSAIANITQVLVIILSLELGPSSINFDFQNVIYPFIWAKYMYKLKLMRDCCKLFFSRSLAALSLALSRILVWLAWLA